MKTALIYLLPLLLVFSFLTASAQDHRKRPGVVQPTIELVGPKAFQQKMKTTKGILLDVRTPSEYKKGHLTNARLLDIFNDHFEASLNKMDKQATYFVYCAVGGRSGEAAEMMNKKGFRLVYDLDGGIDAWKAQGLPVVK